MAGSLNELLAPLLRALWAGHPTQRGRVIRALGQADDATLSADPVAREFRRLLAGESLELTRCVGDLIAKRRLSAYAPDLLRLLREGDAERRARAEAWLGRLARPHDALIRLAAGHEFEEGTRLAALRLLVGESLSKEQRAATLPALAKAELHEVLLEVLSETAEGDEAVVRAAVEANEAFGASLAPPATGFFGRLFRARPSSLGVWPERFSAQRPFLIGIAKLAVKAQSRRWLSALAEFAHEDDFAAILHPAYVELEMREVGGTLLGRREGFFTDERAARTIRLLGKLGHEGAIPQLKRYLPAHGRTPDASGRAAILAMARLGQAAALEPYLEGVAAALRRHLGQTPGSTPAHTSLWGIGVEAAGELGDLRFAALGLDLLRSPRPLEQVALELPPALVRLAPLELLPTVREVLKDEDAPSVSVRQALCVVALASERELLPEVLALARRSPAHADEAAGVVAPLARAEDAGELRGLLLEVDLSDAQARKVFAALREVAAPELVAQIASDLLREGRAGSRTQNEALRFLSEHQAPGAFLRTCVGLFSTPHGAVRTRALKQALRRGLLGGDATSLSVLEAASDDLLALVSAALANNERDAQASKQVDAVLRVVLPGDERGALGADEARVLRRRLRAAGAWVEVATFHSMHRELLEVAELARAHDGRPDVGLLHGALLQRLATQTFRHPTTNKSQRYWGPLPRFDQTFEHPSSFVQEGLFALVASPNYLRTDGLSARFLASPRPSVRARALGLISREGVLVHADAALALLRDEVASVRRAAVERLRALELGRFAESLRPLLADEDEGVRLAATRALAEWGDASCLGTLSAFLGSEDPTLRREAVKTLRRFDPAALEGVLAPAVNDADPRTAAAALAALRPDRLPEDEALGDAIFALAAQGAGPLRARALSFLPALASPRRLGEVVPLLRDRHPEVRAAAAAVLRRRDGRRHAPAVAQLAASTDSSSLRLEALALLADLGVAETAGELVPLLLDEDARVRQATRRALRAARGFSLQDALIGVLWRGLEEGASPEALADLVGLLGDVGGEDLDEVWVEALRCEDRRVWELALRGAADRGENLVLVKKLEDTLHATPPLPAALVNLALRELDRRGARARRRTLQGVLALAKPAAGPQARRASVRRKAISLLAAWDHAEARALAQALSDEASKELKALEKEAAIPAKKGGRDLRRELARARADLTSAQRVLLSLAASGSTGLAAQLKAVPEGARASASLRREAVAAVRDAWLEDASFDPLALRAVLPAEGGRSRQLPVPASAAFLVRDRVSSEEFLARTASLRKHLPVSALVHAQLLAGEEVALKEWVATIDYSSYRAHQGEEQVLACMRSWRPALAEEFSLLVAHGAAYVKGLKADRWGGRDRKSNELADRYARAKLKLALSAPTPKLNELFTDAGARLRFAMAEDDLAPLLAALKELSGESKARERAELAGGLGEVGTPAARDALVELSTDPSPEVRAAVGAALLRLRPEARSGISEVLARLLTESRVDAPKLLAAAFDVIARFRLREHEGAVRKELAEGAKDFSEATRAALQAAAALELEGVGPALVAMLQSAPDSRKHVIGALHKLASAAEAPALRAALLELDLGGKQLSSLARVCSKHLPESELAALAAGLGAKQPPRLAAVLGILRERGAFPGAAPIAVLNDLLRHPDAGVRAEACACVAGLVGEDAPAENRAAAGAFVETLQELTARDAAIDVRASAVRALGQVRLAGEGEAVARAALKPFVGAEAPLHVAALEGLSALSTAVIEADPPALRPDGSEDPSAQDPSAEAGPAALVARLTTSLIRQVFALYVAGGDENFALPSEDESPEALSARWAAGRHGGRPDPASFAAEFAFLRAHAGARRAEQAEALAFCMLADRSQRPAAWKALKPLFAEPAEDASEVERRAFDERIEKLVAVGPSVDGVVETLLRHAPETQLARYRKQQARWMSSNDKRRYVRCLGQALASADPEQAKALRGELRCLLLENDPSLRWSVRRALDPERDARPEAAS